MVVAFKRTQELAPTLLLDLVVPNAKGITYSPKLAIPMAAQSMAAGQIGESGAPVVSPAAVAFKDAHELAQILLLEMVVVIAMGITYSPNLAIPMDAQFAKKGVIHMIVAARDVAVLAGDWWSASG